MKSLNKLIAAMAVMIMCVAFAGCGGGSGYSEGEQFQLGEDTYALEKVVRAIDEDTSSTECYGVSLLHVGNSAPVIISGLGTSGALSTQSAIDLTLTDGDTTYSPRSISFAATEVEGDGSRVVFYVDIPTGTALPTSGTLKGTSDEETVELNLSGMTPETETTTTTTTSSGLPEGVPIAPDAGNENYDGIGNTDVYEGIGDTDIFNADDTIQDDIVQPGF